MKVLKLFFLILIFSCSNPTDKQLIDDFIMNYVVNNYDTNREKLDNYIDIKEDESGKMREIVNSYIDVFQQYNSGKYDYTVINHSQLDESYKIDREIDYSNKNSIYYMVLENKEIRLFFIVENGKIISFTNNPTKRITDKSTPFFMN